MECSYVLCPVYIHSRNSTYIQSQEEHRDTHESAKTWLLFSGGMSFFGASFHWLTDGGKYGMFIAFPFHSCKIRTNPGT